MNPLTYDLWLRGGVARTAELRALGHSDRAIARGVRSGHVIRARRGLLASSQLDPLELVAVRSAGRLTGAAGTRRHGIWSPHHATVDIALAPHARSPRRTEAVIVRADWGASREAGTRSLVGLTGCLIRMSHVEDSRFTFASVESALHLRRLTRAEHRRVVSSAPRDVRRFLARAGSLSESGGESLAKFGMLRASIPFRQQVVIEDVGRVDFVVGRRLVVEIDGAEFHATPESFERDRRRDARLTALGFRVLRFSYLQVLHRWHEVEAALRAAVARGDHR